ncbi:hypothetical protein HYV64_05625 [Candidatus Shapirobacteria bacterium]|nr:hypothetical protein [Candidatus Shapirobacteria bacterium]
MRLFIGLVLVAVVMGAYLVMTKTNFQNRAILIEPGKVIDNTVSKYETNYLYFEYPKKYNLVDIPVRDGRVYTSVKFEGNPEKVLVMDLLFRESTQTLNELTDIKMRRANTYQYAEEVARIGDNRGFIFRTADRKERVAYFMKKGRLLQVTMITSGLFSEDIEEEFQNILQSAVWK